METTVDKLKIGTPVMFGCYGVRANEPHPIVWLKATPNGDFISERVLDMLCFDASERNSIGSARWGGSPDYVTSNPYRFLNSEELAWYTPAHETDAPPTLDRYGSSRMAYQNHPGFLYYFEEYELLSLAKQIYRVKDIYQAGEHPEGGLLVESLIRLPSREDIIGDQCLKLFTKKGIRPKGSDDLVTNKGYTLGYDGNSFFPFWTADRRGDYSTYIGRSGAIESDVSNTNSGVRPMCKLKPDTVVKSDVNGLYRIKPYTVTHETFTDEEFFKYLGIE